MSGVTSQNMPQNGVFSGALNQWITSFWATALAANLLATCTQSPFHGCVFLNSPPFLLVLLISRIWYINRKLTRLGASSGGSQLRPLLQILLDAGAIYSVTLLVALICFVSQSNGQYVILDMVSPSYLAR